MLQEGTKVVASNTHLDPYRGAIGTIQSHAGRLSEYDYDVKMDKGGEVISFRDSEVSPVNESVDAGARQ